MRGYKAIRCCSCRLPLFKCICDSRPNLKTESKFWLLMNSKEINKPTNTGKIIKDCIPETKIVFWERLNPPKELIASMEDTDNFCVVFPDSSAENCINLEDLDSLNDPSFIIIDGTWKQARKIYNKSTYLHKLPTIFVKSHKKSNYILRKAAEENYLCTAEIAIELLKAKKESSAADQLNNFLKLFITTYASGSRRAL